MLTIAVTLIAICSVLLTGLLLQRRPVRAFIIIYILVIAGSFAITYAARLDSRFGTTVGSSPVPKGNR